MIFFTSEKPRQVLNSTFFLNFDLTKAETFFWKSFKIINYLWML